MKTIRRLIHDRSGATALEYGLIAALVFLAALAAMTLMGEQVEALWNDLSAAVIAAVG